MSNKLQRLTKRLMKLELILSALLLGTPAVLILVSGELRPSISNYQYSTAMQHFTYLLGVASIMFVVNGSIWNKHWYNIVLGVSLTGVIFTPHLEFPTLHNVFAGLFFIGSIFVMIYFSSSKQRIYKVAAGLFITIGLLGHFIANWYTLFFAEWIGILPITVHFIGESIGKID